VFRVPLCHAWITVDCAIVGAACTAISARPIRIVVGFAAGGPTDVAGRLVSQKFTEKWGQPVIVESRPAPAAISQRNL
jgi:tripartite-type tricarboxylate transporter receptor subunit TctC